MRPEARKSTLFPYTTLFRSVKTACPKRRRESAILLIAARAIAIWSFDRRSHVWSSKGAPEDRKSTRLNSSHTVISYAVFCLKKKITGTSKERERDACFAVKT